MDFVLEDTVETAIKNAQSMEIDREFLTQSDLDVRVRSRVNALPWRGQFTPDLAKTLLAAYTKAGDRVLDPFAGSGTTLSESIGLGLSCVGTEINPAAIELSRVFETAALPADIRGAKIRNATRVVHRLIAQTEHDAASLFSLLHEASDQDSSLLDQVLAARKDASDPWLANILAVSLMMAMGDGKVLAPDRLGRAFNQVSNLLTGLPGEPVPCEVYAADARRLPVDSNSIDFVLTSPPYINVFNYHQNYRPVVEALGYHVLSAAQREIGSNRKFRQNRFMTVIQYCQDMMLSLRELARVCKGGSKVVIVVGRESRVRKVPLPNGAIVGSLGELSGSLRLERWQERQFTSRFGEKIFEEILTFDVADTAPLDQGDAIKLATDIGRSFLADATGIEDVPSAIKAEIMAAIEAAWNIQPSLFEGEVSVNRKIKSGVSQGSS
ncbi:DNA methyltransferase [Micromonospora wenchangensis]|uniref:DNA methyltransferase n=1 Tax=Micromonospora wenchangensis TaxID=1185415 RepID=UPI0037F7A433